jgi:predicted porin
MQKKLLAAAVLSAFSGAAAAQSANVTIYGTLYSDIEEAGASGGDGTTTAASNAGGGGSTFRTTATSATGGATTLNAGTAANLGNGNFAPTAAQAAAGQAGVANPAQRARLQGAGSNFGLRGTEDLGNGLAAWFQLEVGTAAATGAVQATSSTSLGGYQGLTYRNTAIGLKSNAWGSILMGIWDTPLTTAYGQASLVPKFLSINSLNSQAGFFGTTPYLGGGTFSGTSINQACAGAGGILAVANTSAAACLTATSNMDRRQAGTLQWWSPNWNGFEGRLMFTPSGESFATITQNLAPNTTLGAASLNTLHPYMWGLSANYSNGGLFLSYAYQRIVDFTAAGVRSFGGIGLSNNTAANNGSTGNFGVSMAADMTASTDDDHRIGAKYKFDSGFGIGARWERMKGAYSYANAPGAVAATSALTDFNGYTKTTWGLAGSFETGPHAVMLEYAKSNNISVTGTQGPTAAAGSISGAGTGANMWDLAYDYALSKRTDVRAYVTIVNNQANARYTGVVFNGVQPVAGGDPRYYGVGLRHTF